MIGRVLEVRVRNTGGNLSAQAVNTDTTLSLDSVYDFDDNGGTLVIEDVMYDYTSIDREANTITLTSALADLQEALEIASPVLVYPYSDEKFALAYIYEDQDPILARIPHSLKDRMADRIRDDAEQEIVQIAIDGSEYIIEDIIGVKQSLVSGDTSTSHMIHDDDGITVYGPDGVTPVFTLDPDTGAIAAESASFSSFGAAAGAYDTLSINDMSAFPSFPGSGGDLASEVFPHFGLGAIAFAKGDGTTTAPNITSSSGETAFFYFQTGPLYADRNYLIIIQWNVTDQGSMSNNDWYRSKLRWEADDTKPNTPANWTLVPNSQDINFYQNHGFHADRTMIFYTPPSDLVNGYFAFTLDGAGISGTMSIANGGTNQPYFMFIDLGPAADVAGTLDVGTASATKSSYTKTFKPTWARSYNGDGSIYTNYGVETDDMYQGYWSSTHGNSKCALGGFKVNGTGNTIATEVASTAANITKIKITWKVKHAGDGAGLDVSYGSHADSSNSSTWGGITGKNANQGTKNNCAAGSSYSVTLTSGAVFNQIASDLAAGGGLLFGPGPTTGINYYGYLYGLNSVMPKIELTYLK